MEADITGVVPVGAVEETTEETLRGLYDADFMRLVSIARLLLNHREDAEEVVQEAFARTLAKIGRVRGDDLSPYVRRAVVNLSRGRLRRLRTASAYRPERPADAESAEAGAARAARAQAVLDQLHQLPARQRECVVLRFYDDLTVPEIARVLSVAEGSVKSHLHRALSTLAHSLGEEVR